jgi:hypothetical protein
MLYGSFTEVLRVCRVYTGLSYGSYVSADVNRACNFMTEFSALKWAHGLEGIMELQTRQVRKKPNES